MNTEDHRLLDGHGDIARGAARSLLGNHGIAQPNDRARARVASVSVEMRVVLLFQEVRVHSVQNVASRPVELAPRRVLVEPCLEDLVIHAELEDARPRVRAHAPGEDHEGPAHQTDDGGCASAATTTNWTAAAAVTVGQAN